MGGYKNTVMKRMGGGLSTKGIPTSFWKTGNKWRDGDCRSMGEEATAWGVYGYVASEEWAGLSGTSLQHVGLDNARHDEE